MHTNRWFCKTLSTKHPSVYNMLSKITVPILKTMLSTTEDQVSLDRMAQSMQPLIAQIELMVGLFYFYLIDIIVLFPTKLTDDVL